MRKILLTLVSFVGLSVLVACGGDSSHTSVPPAPSTGNNAGFSNSSLKGTYVFSASGFNSSSNYNYAVVGVFIADGAGNISSGTRDTVNDNGGQSLSEPITGTYSVNQDGRGQAVLNGNSGQVIYRFVMQSTTSAKLFQISNTSDAVGRILGVPVVTPALISAAPYIVRLDGEDTKKNPYGAIGALTMNGPVAGTIDENDAGTFSPQLTATGTTTTTGPNGRGTLTFTTSTGTHNFIYYPVTSSHFEMISTDKNFFLFGYGDQQTALIAASPAAFGGDQVLNLAGYSTNGAIVETGRLTLDGAGNLTNAIEDYNEAGFFFPSVAFAGTYTVGANGRWAANLVYSTSTLSVVGWQVSTSQSVVLTTGSTIANYSVLETGTLRAQTLGLTTASISGEFAEDLSGIFVGTGNVESTGNFLADGAGNLSGTFDSQTPFADNTDVSQTGLYSVLANGRSAGTVGSVPVVFYTVNADTVYMISSDPNRLYQGKLEKQ